MKKIAIVILMVPILFSCSLNDGDSEKNIALIEKYVSSVQNLDYDVMETMLDDNYIGLGPSHSDSIGKEQTLKNWKYNIENLYERISYKRSRNIATHIESGENQGHWVSNWADLTIVYKENNESVTIWANTLYQIKNDKIVKSYTIYNEADALEQLGFVFINPNNL